ncbi:S8 family serine peptidase [Marinobacter shengliensis]|uniref:S8 family serine peptidase n=1 Tax=Marinobacter shengliensis TaxID=1389223 RepID=UPI00148617E9|nr:S8 family serine peptidase [Marinobacter shengliensis]
MNKSIFLIFGVSLLAACGSGGSSDSEPSPIDNGVVEADHLDAINATYAAARSITGAGVTVAVIDSGVNILHDEFAGKTLNANSASFSSPASYYTAQEIEDMNLEGRDLIDAIETGPQEDVQGHGTHVTGQVWGENVGVAPGVDLIMLDVYEQFTPDSVTAKGLIEDLPGFGVDFANASLTGVDYYENSAFLDERPIFEPLDANNIGWIVAAGNFGVDMTDTFVTNPVDCGTLTQEQRDANLSCRFVFNANDVDLLVKDRTLADNFLWVGAVDDETFEVSEFTIAGDIQAGSNVPGNDPDIQARWISAPGTLVNGPFFDNADEYLSVSGTSQAAPLVTGAAALVKSQFPTMSNDKVLQVLLDTADDTFAGYDVTLHGQGVLDVEAALKVDPADYDPI